MPSSYDDDDLPATREELRNTFKLVRLQILSPLSLLVSAGATIVCNSLIKPNMCQFSRPPFSHFFLSCPVSLSGKDPVAEC